MLPVDALQLAPVPTEVDALRLAAGDVVLELDAQGKILRTDFSSTAPEAIRDLFELAAHITANVHLDDRTKLRRALQTARLQDELTCIQVRVLAEAETLELEWRIAPCRIEGRPRLVAVARNASEQHRNEQRLRYLATHDALTTLPNRSFLDEQLPELARQAAENDETLALGVIDLDGFKRINDSLGHPAGDELLRTVAGRLMRVVRETDVVVRMGGDEFVVVLPRVGCTEDLLQTGRRITAALEAPVALAGKLVHISGSVGFAVYPDHASDIVRLNSHADTALYRAKAAGKNRTVVYDPQWNVGEDRLSMESALRAGFAAGEFFPVYQPILDVATGRVVGCEALMRWDRPGFGLVPPSTFIPVAESIGLIDALGLWMLRAACMQVLAFEKHTGQRLFVSVNLSPAQFHGDLAQKVFQSLALTGLPGERLRLEITEGALMRDPQLTEQVLKELTQHKVSFAIDDFGTGHASFAYLRNFPLHTLKIDQTFIEKLPSSRKDAAICSALFQLAEELGLQCVAEGVETLEQWQFLREKRCTLAQGYLLGRPMPANEFVQFLTEKTHEPAAA
jgi:diguanylate cyclase (GGDEF)-like protein